jgi:hypothetical protein
MLAIISCAPCGAHRRRRLARAFAGLRMSRTIRAAFVTGTAIILSAGAFAAWEALRWRRERDAQCNSAMPLVQSHARLSELRALRERPPSEYRSEDATHLLRIFSESSDKGLSILTHLRDGNGVLVFSESNSIMFIYTDGEGKAFRAECFLQ